MRNFVLLMKILFFSKYKGFTRIRNIFPRASFVLYAAFFIIFQYFIRVFPLERRDLAQSKNKKYNDFFNF